MPEPRIATIKGKEDAETAMRLVGIALSAKMQSLRAAGDGWNRWCERLRLAMVPWHTLGAHYAVRVIRQAGVAVVVLTATYPPLHYVEPGTSYSFDKEGGIPEPIIATQVFPGITLSLKLPTERMHASWSSLPTSSTSTADKGYVPDWFPTLSNDAFAERMRMKRK